MIKGMTAMNYEEIEKDFMEKWHVSSAGEKWCMLIMWLQTILFKPSIFLYRK